MPYSPEDALTPMLAKAVATIPAADSVEGGLSYEPKWDGFRAIIYFDGETVEIGSRGSKMLTRYFPELVEAFVTLLPRPCVLDGEIVVRAGEPGHEKLDWETLSQRIHPAASRVAKLSVETPAMFVAFDLLAIDDDDYASRPFGERREALETLLAGTEHPVHLSQVTTDEATANRWLVEFEGAGLDGVVSKPLAAPYAPGKRVMLKTKHHRSADVVVIGYRMHTSGQGVGSLLLGLYTAEGELQGIGGASAFSNARRLELIDELAPYAERDADGEMVRGETDRSRFSGSKDVSFVRLRPELVVEVRYDQMEGSRFRHTVQFDRWRPDREARSCTFDQLDRPIAYDLSEVLV
ncbi:ATP-dependent DNA ligase [Subtercola boreus]|uniref:DNA ligase (ATP) n=1 Tax=Subtercola boreus TaxID=120213 RepID=A0A3E0WDM0_9MICO|nr:ATP-dependent DNA ligase [Subtercola boreus]RFA21017.1 ATP-dependent DNA ligase [Subtercola boreus]RFA21401.1 ATP-dependent DNA ligase [Subtercola boreus]RFA27372.1 ATP-dependent DNA ligase [Subtercola boreus]